MGMGGASLTDVQVSVVVPTRDRPGSLRKLLAALADQSYTRFEVIVVDDGSTDVDAVASMVGPASRSRVIRTEGVGAVGARCVGVKDATGEILAFTDDDCVPHSDWLRLGVEAIDAGADVVQGRTIPERPVTPLERSLAHAATDGMFPTCNVLYRRTAYDRAGGFDRFVGDRLGFRPDTRARSLGFGEDTLLGWTVARAGRAAAVPEMVVSHEVLRPPLRELFSRAWTAGAFPRLVHDVPELRDTLLRNRVVLGKADARLSVYGLTLMLVGPLRLIGVAVAAGWVVARATNLVSQPASALERLVGLPVRLALDVTTSVALVAGSVRARTPVV